MVKRYALLGVIVWLMMLVLPGIGEALEDLQVGMKAPAIALPNLDGEEVRFSSFPKAKLFVVVFWSTWSDSSAAELERLEQLYRKYQYQGLVVLAVNVESQRHTPEEMAAIRTMVNDLGLTFPVLIDRGLETFHRYGVIAIPSTVAIDKTGVIRAEMSAYPIVGREELFEQIEALVLGKKIKRRVKKAGYEPVPRAVRYYNLSRVMRSQGQIEQVDLMLRKAIESDPKFILPLILLARVYKERALFEEAIEYKGKAYTTATFRQEREQNLQEAIVLLKRALTLDPKHPSALTELASIYLLQGKVAEAEPLLRKALEADSSYTPAHYLLGAVLYKRGEQAQGQQEFDTAQKLNPLDPNIYYTMAQAYEEAGRLKEAVKAYRKSLEILWNSRHRGT